MSHILKTANILNFPGVFRILASKTPFAILLTYLQVLLCFRSSREKMDFQSR